MFTAFIEKFTKYARALGSKDDFITSYKQSSNTQLHFAYSPKPVLYKTMCTEAERHTVDYIAAEIIKIIDDIGPQKFIGIVTDNATAMEKANYNRK